MTTRTNQRSPDRSRDRRGVAMLLVIITLATATILTTTYLTSRSNSVAIGHTATSAASSEWAARSAAALTEAVFETDVDWRAAASDSKLLEGFAFNGAQVEVVVTDTDGNPPDNDDTEVVVTVVAAMEGVSATTQRIVRVRPPANREDAVDPGLNEFGAFNAGAVTAQNEARIEGWPLSPAYRAGKRPKIGLGFESGGDMSIANGAIPGDALLYLTADATSSLIAAAQAKFDVEVIDAPVKGAVADLPSGFFSLPTRSIVDLEIRDGRSDHTLEGGTYQDLEVRDDTTVTLGGGGVTDYNFEDLVVGDDGVLRIEGDVRILTRLDADLFNEGLIELADGATLQVFTGGDVSVDNAVIGFDRPLSQKDDRSIDDVVTWVDPRRIQLMQVRLPWSPETPGTQIQNRAIVLGSLHQPLGDVSLNNDSAIAGRVSAERLTIDNRSRVLLDPVFDNEMGLTSTSGPLYDENGDLIPELRDALETVDPTAGMDAVKAALLAALPEETAPEDPGADEVTPRRADAVDSWAYPVDAYQQERGKTDPGTTFLRKSVDTILVDTGVTVDNIVGDLADGLLGGGEED